MTEANEKTNELLRRRKLRLQQVREQSKDVAKKIRQRAKIENLRQVVEIDSKKQKEYLRRQERLVKQLEEYYAKGIENIGASHRNASEIKLRDDQEDKVDLSKQRGKEAAAEIRKKRQRALDNQKKILERKLHARETANEISREKSVAVVNKLQSKLTVAVDCNKDGNSKHDDKNVGDVAKSDMATQWDLEEMPNEWESNIPTLSLPNDDISVKESNNNNVDSKSDKSKRLDLFAVSDEMPSSLRGGITNQGERVPVKTSLTLVSEYLQNRGLRLRETETTRSTKKMDDLQNIKQTILRTRASKEVSAKDDTRPIKLGTESSAVLKRSSVTMYNHATRDSKNIPYEEERLVVRDLQDDDDDAYSQAMKESTINRNVEKKHDNKIAEIRSKVAMTKQNIEKEYRDTMSFLNALPKDKGNKSIKTAYMDEHRQQMQKDSRQQKLQNEYRKIENECRKLSSRENVPKKFRSPSKGRGDVFETTDLQYSWMPVPESDGNLAIHTIPTTVKEGKSVNTVKFSKVDSYHEYRSRHKHTPPTKDTFQDKPSRNVEAVVIQSPSDTESDSSESLAENIRVGNKKKTEDNTEKLSDAERIIIYKIMDSKTDKANAKKTTKLMKNIAKSLSLIDKRKETKGDNRDQDKNDDKNMNGTEGIVSFEQLNEGVYKTENKKNGDNIASMYFHNIDENTKEAPDPKQCICSKGLCRECQKYTDSFHPQWESGDKPPTPTSRSRKSCGKRNCKCGQKITTKEIDISVVQPTTTASTTSFQTQADDKTNNHPAESGFIKLADDGGLESGKFYIGTSGLLRNEAYEVVIQLRKKGDEREDKTNKPETKSIDEVAVNTTQTCMKEIQETNNNTEPVPTLSVGKELVQEIIETGPTLEAVVNDEVQTNPNLKKTMSISTNGNDFKTTDRHVSEKGIGTETEDVFVLSDSKLQSRPATSTYTQTSFSNNRPMFFHMSSSTSTTYMSPPEMIVPKFLKYEYRYADDEEVFDPRNDMEEVDSIHEYSEENDCKCEKCRHATKVRLNKNTHAPAPRFKICTSRITKTPPNTARSVKSYTGNKEEICCRENKKTEVPHSKKKSKCCSRTCQNHVCHNRKHDVSNSASHKKSRRLKAATHSSQNILRVTANTTSSNKNSQATSERKTNLKPIVKNYVDKLLMLNKVSLNAFHVIEQDCSSITTPGSSIIDVPHNVNQQKPILENKLSLLTLRSLLKQSIIDKEKNYKHTVDSSNQNIVLCLKKQTNKNYKPPKLPRKKTTHKVKSLNISKKMYKTKKSRDIQKLQNNTISSSSSSKKECDVMSSTFSRRKCRSKSSPTPRLAPNHDFADKRVNQDMAQLNSRQSGSQFINNKYINKTKHLNERKTKASQISESPIPATPASTSPDFGRNPSSLDRNNVEIPMSISTQTSINVDTDMKFIKLAEGKLQNMEKIADLTEKCTKRLSNLAKVLEEVRKNKTLAYSQISTSDTTSDSDQKSENNVINTPAPSFETFNDTNKKSDSKYSAFSKMSTLKEDNKTLDSSDYIPLLTNIPKPVVAFKGLNSDFGIDSSSSSSKKSNSPSPLHESGDHPIRNRKPPPALSRIHLKLGQDGLIPHELSTVVEVDSPMSVKLKSSRNETKTLHPDQIDAPNASDHTNKWNSRVQFTTIDTSNNPDLLDCNVELLNAQHIKPATEPTVDSGIQMMDIKKFNEIMLKPFFSIQEYAKQCNAGALDDGSNLDDIMKDEQLNDELSSLHSEASLPDVISELLKRNIISEPFKFDTGSNANSTIVSSESTMSVLALSKVRQVKNKSNAMLQNKDNIGETSDTLSISSNPDLEHAFKKLGMGWASSTLKKTKERLALSSSSNTSSSSLSEFKIKNFNQDIPALVTDTVLSSVLKPSKKQVSDGSKNAGQQTSISNSMTVKEFLTNELAKKITFDRKSRNETEEKFITLYETKMPEEMKHSSLMVYEENTIDNTIRSGNNNRARTSTPVQLFKSMTYHTSSSSNLSNGLFSNADDLSSVKLTSNSMKHSTSDKDDLIIPSFSLRMKKGNSECSKSD